MLFNHLFCYFLYVHCLRPCLRSLVRRISTRPAGTLPPSRPSERFPGSTELGEEEEEEEKEAAASSSLDRPEDEATRALLRPCSTSPPGKGMGAARHGKRGAVDRPGAVSRLNINGIF